MSNTITKTLPTLKPGNFSPSRFKQLDSCKWQYVLQRLKYIYPRDPIIEPHSQLGSAMHHVAEFYEPLELSKPNLSKANALIKQALAKYVLTDDQIEELEFMVDNLIYRIWPALEGNTAEHDFTVTECITEYNIKQSVIFDDTNGQAWKVPLNQKIDRFVRTDDGRVIVMDYKKGKRSVSSHMFQLLFYVTTVSQVLRVPLSAIEIWLIFPNEKNRWIETITGSDLQDEIPSFLEHMAQLITTHNQVVKDPPTENDANTSFLCNFCAYNATDFCPLSKMLNADKIAENADRVFETGYKVKKIVDPKDVISSSSAW